MSEMEEDAPHLLSFCTHDSQETLWEARVSEKTNEIPVAKAVLPTLPLAGRVCTADALHTHADFMHLLQERQTDTVLTVKGNQPTLFADRATYSELNAYLAADWPHVAQVAQLIRTVTKAGTTSTEVVYHTPSLSPQRASPQRLLALVCGHRKPFAFCPGCLLSGRPLSSAFGQRPAEPHRPSQTGDHSASSLRNCSDFIGSSLFGLSSQASSCFSVIERRQAIIHKSK